MNFDQFIPLWLTPDVAVIAMAGLAALFSVLALWYAILQRDPMSARLKMLSERRATLKAGLASSHRRDGRHKRSIGLMRRVVSRARVAGPDGTTKVQEKLVQAGFRSRDAVVIFMFFKLAMPLILGVAAVFVLFVLKLYQLDPMVNAAITVGVVAIGYMTPSVFLRNAIDKRKHALRKSLPDALDLMVICAEAGLSMDAAFSRVAREMALGGPEMADEFGLVSIELSFLPERRKALENLNARTDMQEVRGVVNTLIQTEKYGTPLASSLRVLATEFRNERLMRAEEKAARLPATLTVPMVIFILPSLFVVLIGPAAIRVVDALSKM